MYDGTGSHDTLRVKLALNANDISKSQWRSVLVPFAAQVVPVVDISKQCLEIDPPEGLLDVVNVKKLKRQYTPEQQKQLLEQLQQQS